MTAITAIKEATPCADCGGHFPACAMDFDHKDSTKKRASVSDLVNKSWHAIADEIAKCDIVCANCHRIRSHQRGQHLQTKTERSQLELVPSPCQQAGGTPAVGEG